MTGVGPSRKGARRASTETSTAETSTADTSRASRWRVALRLAQRQVRRTRASSLLVMLLVGLPIAGMSGAAVYVDSLVATPEERVRAELGAMQAWVDPVGVPGAGLWQDPVYPLSHGYPVEEDGSMRVPEGEDRTDIDGALPDGTQAIPLSQGNVRIETVGGVASVTAWGGEIWHDGFEGLFRIVEGRAPRSDDEVLATAATLERTGAAVGGTLTDAADGRAYEIVGTFSAAALPAADSGVVFADARRFDDIAWFLPDLALGWTEVQQLNEQGIVAYSREVALDPPRVRFDGSPVTDERLATMWQLTAALAIGGAFAAYMVIMLAGAAFAVSARRQQRALAIAASVGADARDLRRVILLQGTVLGAVGGLVGVAAGVGLAAGVIAVTDDGSMTRFWGFHVPWPVLAGIFVFAVVVGTFSAAVPARTVSRSDTISALRGSRRPQAVRASRPVWGSLMILGGVGLTVLSGLAAAAVARDADLSGDSPLRWLPIAGIIAGPVVAQLGIVLSGRWLLWLASRALARAGVAPRLASRDAVANGSRTVPAFAAIGATVFIGVFALALGTMSAAQSARAWRYSSPVGTAVVSFWATGDEPDPLTKEQAVEAAAVAGDLLREAGADRVAVIDAQPEIWGDAPEDIPAEPMRAVAVTPERSLVPRDEGFSSSEYQSPQNNLSIVAVDDLETVTGVTLSAAQRRDYVRGAALVLNDLLVTDGAVEVAAWPVRVWAWGVDGDAATAPDNMFEPDPAQPSPAEPTWVRSIPAFEVEARQQALSVAIDPATADELGLRSAPASVVAAFDDGATQAEEDRVDEINVLSPSDDYGLAAEFERGPQGPSSWLIPLLAAVSVLVVGASSVALGLARFERRPDDATLAAVGGGVRLRRGIGFWQGLVIAGFGTFAGAAAGVLPAVGFQMQSEGNRFAPSPLDLADVPWWIVGVVAIALPLAIALVNWAVPPRHPDLTRRTAIA